MNGSSMMGEDLLRWLADADDLRHRHPRRALLRARALRDLAASIEPPPASAPVATAAEGGDAGESRRQWNRLQASAWGVLGSAHRSVGDRARAESALAVALAFLETPTDTRPDGADPETDLGLARLAQRLSYVRCDQQRFDEALALNDDALRLFDRAGDARLAASVRVDRALFFHRSGQTRRAIPLLIHALGRLDEESQPRVFLAAVHNLGFYLSLEARDADQEREALAWLELGWQLHLEHPEEPGLLRLRAVAALMALRRGHVEEATEALASCRAGFAELGAMAEQAAVLLHLVALAFEEGRNEDVRAFAAQLAPILHHLGLPEPARAMLRRFLGADAWVEIVEEIGEERGAPEIDTLETGTLETGTGIVETAWSEVGLDDRLDVEAPSSVPSTEPDSGAEPGGPRTF